jgi:hypothetical protein
MEEQHFDDLARLVAQKTSRRQVLKVLAGAALGGMFANRLSPALAAGAGGCAKYCNQVFGEDTAATTQCIQDAKKGTGLCYTCGPMGSGGTLCGGPSYSTTTCCSGSTSVCTSGTCTGTCGDGCSSMGCATCSSGTCTCVYPAVGITTINNTQTCVRPCTSSAACQSGNCAPNMFGGICIGSQSGDTCSRNQDCPQGYFCNGTSCLQASC